MQQAALELREEDEARERIHELHSKTPEPPEVSNWWWLLPPIKFILENRQRNRYRTAIRLQLTKDDMALLLTYMNRARAWLYVGLGGLFIAISETVSVFDAMQWPRKFVPLLFIALTLLCLSSVVRIANQRATT